LHLLPIVDGIITSVLKAKAESARSRAGYFYFEHLLPEEQGRGGGILQPFVRDLKQSCAAAVGMLTNAFQFCTAPLAL